LWLTTDGTDWERVASTGRFPLIEAVATNGTDIFAWKPPIKNGNSNNPKLLAGSPMYVSTDPKTWEHPTPHMLDGAFVYSATFTPDGRLLLVGSDIGACEGEEFFCVFEGGAIPAVWVGTPS
jgi:hypothetical protein